MMNRLALAMALAAMPLAACGSDDDSRSERHRLVDEADCDTSGHACSWLGMAGEEGFNGDGLHRLDTRIYWSFDMLFASDGTPWFIDWNNHLVRKVLPDGTVESVLGWTDPVFPGDGGPGETSAEGALGTDVQLNHPTDLTEAPDGTILVMAWHNHKLRKIDPSTGRVRVVCGGGAGFAGDGMDAALAVFRQPKGLQRDGADLYILDQANLRIRKIDGATNVISTIAGTGMPGFGGDGGPAVMAMFGFETGSNPEPSGGLVISGRQLFIADTLNDRIRVVDLDTGIIDTFAGTGTEGFSGDGGPAAEAQLANPRDLEIGPEGDLYIADTDNSRIRAINLTDGTIRTVAGTGQLGLDPDEGRLAIETTLKRPFAIEFDPAGNLYISDTINSRIVRVAR